MRPGKQLDLLLEPDHARLAATGTLQAFASQALRLPAGLLIAAYLTRKLGPERYGVLMATHAIVLWLESSTGLAFNRVTVKRVAESGDWPGAVSSLARAQLIAGLIIGACLAAIAPFLASLLRSPEITPYLRLFAVDIPLFILANLHLAILTGRRDFGLRAGIMTLRLAANTVLVFVLVGIGLSIYGAILATIGASLLGLLSARVYVKPKLWGAFSGLFHGFGGYGWPLLLYAIAMNLLDPIGLLAVKALDPDPGAAGFYGAARNLTVTTSLFTVAFTPILLATLTHLSHRSVTAEARNVVRGAMRLVVCLVPFAGVVAGSAGRIAGLIYGDSFLAAGTPLALLIFGSVAVALTVVNGSSLIAAGRPRLLCALTIPMVPVALAAQLWLVPRFGIAGAALGSLAVALAGGVTSSLAVHRIWEVRLAPETILRVAVVTLLAWGVSAAWKASGGWLVAELAAVSAIAIAALVCLGEIGRNDLKILGWRWAA
jgi:O-antigen/teichoic acid export membrane protein